MSGKDINNSKSTAIAVPEQPDLGSLIAALEGLGASKNTSSQDRGTDPSLGSGSGSGSDYLLTPALGSSSSASAAATRAPSSISAATPPVTEVEDRDINRQWYHVTQTNDRGIALTAARRIPAGTLILFEPALIKIPLSAENDGTAIDSKVNALSKPERKKFLQLFDPKPGSGGGGNGSASKASGIYNSNCYNINAYDDEGGSCLGLLSARINHSCLPNLLFSYVPAAQVASMIGTPTSATAAAIAELSPADQANALRRGMMQFHAIKTISKGKELVSNYEKSIFVGRKTRIERLRRHYGFDCSCEACAPTSDFWQRSDARRKAMEECVRAGAAFEREWTAAMMRKQGGHVDDHQVEEQDETTSKKGVVIAVAERAVAKLQQLEGLLLKEGLIYTPLANCYKSLAKWTCRMGQNATPWLEKEHEVLIRCFGRDSHRAQVLAAQLSQDGRCRSLVEDDNGTKYL